MQSESRKSQTNTTNTTSTTAQPTPFRTYGSTTANEKTGTLTHNTSMSQSLTSFRTTTPTSDTTGRTNTIRTTPNTIPHVTQDMSCNRLPQCCIHQPTSQVCKPGESLALRKVKDPLNGRTSVSRLPLTKQDILSQYSGCFEGIGCFPGDAYKFHLKPDYKPARHAPRKVPHTLGAQDMYEIHQELIRRQHHKPEKNYIELTPGMAVWVQHRQNTS